MFNFYNILKVMNTPPFLLLFIIYAYFNIKHLDFLTSFILLFGFGGRKTMLHFGKLSHFYLISKYTYKHRIFFRSLYRLWSVFFISLKIESLFHLRKGEEVGFGNRWIFKGISWTVTIITEVDWWIAVMIKSRISLRIDKYSMPSERLVDH